MIQLMTERQQVRMWLEPESKDEIERAQERYGMKQQELLSRIVRWFAAQDEGVQVAVLDLLPRGHEEGISRAILAKLAKGPHATPLEAED